MRASDLRDLFFQKLNKHLSIPPKKALVLVSGGLDSMVLLHLYAHWLKTVLVDSNSAKLGDFLAVLHLDYGLRPKENLKEQALIKDCCTNLKVPLHLVKAGGVPKKNLQNWARKKRLLVALKKSKAFGYQMILTAHHLDDLVETFLLKLLKGQGVHSLTSFSFRSAFSKTEQGEKIFFLRPLIDFEKAALENYARENGLRYHFDTSNALNDYERNYLRNEILPELLHRFPAAKKNLLTSRSHIKTLKNFSLHFSNFPDENFYRYFIKDRCVIFSDNFFSKINRAEKKLVLHQYFSRQCPWKRFSENDLEELSQKIVRQSKNNTTGKKSSIVLMEGKGETFFFWENAIFPLPKKVEKDKDFLWTVSNSPREIFSKKNFPSFSLMIDKNFSLSFCREEKKFLADEGYQQKFVLGAFNFLNGDYQFRLTRGVEEKSRILLRGKSVSLLKHLKNEKCPAIFRDCGWQLLVKKDHAWQTIAFFCLEQLAICLLQQKINVFGSSNEHSEKRDFLSKKIICSDFLKSDPSYSKGNLMQILLVKNTNSAS